MSRQPVRVRQRVIATPQCFPTDIMFDVSDATTSIQEIPWTEEEVLGLLNLTYDDGTLPPDQLERALKVALADEGTLVPLGPAGRHIRISPGLKKRLGLC